MAPVSIPTYTINAVIGKGSYGTVYRAKDDKTGINVAFKKMKNCFSLSTLREISLLRHLNTFQHPNIVRLLDICYKTDIDGELTTNLVLEYIPQDLAKYIERHPTGFDTSRIRNMSKEILNGVHFLHSHKVLHRDLKPQNLLVTHKGHIKLADFGLARSYEAEMKLSPCVVTFWYRAPEVLLGLPYSTPIDLWSVGCIIVELFTLTPLFTRRSPLNQLDKIFGIIGKPSEDDWPKDVLIKLSSFKTTNQVRINHLCQDMTVLALDLVKKLLAFNPNKRITAFEALNHPFLIKSRPNY